VGLSGTNRKLCEPAAASDRSDRSDPTEPPDRTGKVSAKYRAIDLVRGEKRLARKQAKLGRLGAARSKFERAAALTRNAKERELLLERAGKSGTPTEDD